MSADLVGFVALALISLLLGVIVNEVRRQPLPLVYRSPQQRLQAIAASLTVDGSFARLAAVAATPREIGLDEFQPFVAARKGVVIDARSSAFYAEGHVPGAMNLSRGTLEEDYRRLREYLDARKAAGIAVYCSGADCRDSQLVAEALIALGYSRVLVYKEGWEEWSQSGLPQEK